MIADTVNTNLQRSLRRLEVYSNQLSTGKVFHKPSENPVGVGRVMGYSAAVNRNEQYRLNMNQTRGWLENTEASLRNGLDVLQRVRELSIYGANESLTADDRRAIAPEILEFLEHLIGIANTETNGLYIFGGHQTLSVPYRKEKVYHADILGGGIDPDNAVIAAGLQNGNYSLSQSSVTPATDEDAAIRVNQSYLQGNAESIIGEADWGDLVNGVMIEPELQAGSTVTIGDDFVTGSPVENFVLTLTYDEANSRWDYIDDTGVPQVIDAGTFTHFGITVDIDQLAGAAADGDVITVASGVSSSVMLEVTGVDYESGQVSYRYLSHQYALDGTYQKAEGDFSLTFGDTAPQAVNFGAVTVNVEGLGGMNPFLASGLKVGDRTTLNIIPGMSAGTNYDMVTLSGAHRSSGSAASYLFNQNALNNRDVEFKYYSLDTFDRSSEKGTVYDGGLSVSYGAFSEAEPALTFSYDKMGFPVYYGDYNDRVQEISPHQEMIMNLSGDKAFGMNQEIFEAVYGVYWALIDNDREALGDEALEKMDRAIDHFLGRLAEVGARSNRVDAMNNTLSNENLYLREVRSNIEDIDLAQVITDYLMQENAYKAALSTASMMLQPSLVDYLR
jgi:flagellin-like hook-associated protein FlgL